MLPVQFYVHYVCFFACFCDFFFFFAVIQLPAPLMAAALFAYYPFFIISCGLKSAQSSALCLLIGKPKYS